MSCTDVPGPAPCTRPGARDVGEPRPGLRLVRPGAGAVRRRRRSGHRRAGLRVEVARRGRGRRPLATRRTWSSRRCAPRSTRSAASRAVSTVVCANRIPHGRGLGSSAAAIVSGLLPARWLVVGGDERLPDDDGCSTLAASLEGHPDNVAAALFGGLTVAWRWTGAAATARPDCASAPRSMSRRGRARRVRAARRRWRPARRAGLLPEQVPHADAASTSPGPALLVAALARPATDAAARRRPRTGCTSSTGAGACRGPRRSWPSCARRGAAVDLAVPGPTVLALAGGPRSSGCSSGAAGAAMRHAPASVDEAGRPWLPPRRLASPRARCAVRPVRPVVLGESPWCSRCGRSAPMSCTGPERSVRLLPGFCPRGGACRLRGAPALRRRRSTRRSHDISLLDTHGRRHDASCPAPAPHASGAAHPSAP